MGQNSEQSSKDLLDSEAKSPNSVTDPKADSSNRDIDALLNEVAATIARELHQSLTKMSELNKDEFAKHQKKYATFNGIKVNVNKLTHTNFNEFVKNFGREMRFYSLWCILTKDYTKEVVESEDYRDMNEVALDQLKANVSEYYEQMIEACDTARQCWSVLENHFNGTTLVQSVRVVKQLSSLIVEREPSLEKTVINFKNLQKQLADVHPGLPDELLIAILITLAPPSAEHVVRSVIKENDTLVKQKKKLTIESVIQSFMYDLQLGNEDKSDRMKLVCAIGDDKHKKPFCLYCQVRDHPMSRCPVVARDKANGTLTGDVIINRGNKDKFEKQKPSTSFDRNRKPDDKQPDERRNNRQNPHKKKKRDKKKKDPSDEEGEVVASLLSHMYRQTYRKDRWHLDSGAGANVASCSRGMVKFTKGYERPVYSASMDPCRVSGVAEFLFKTSLGFKFRITNVLFVESIASNFLSYSVLDKAGFTMIGKGGEIKIYDPRNRLFCVGKLVDNGLYELDLEYDQANLQFEMPDEPDDRTDQHLLIAMCSNSKRADTESALENQQTQLMWHKILNHLNNKDLSVLGNDRLGFKVDKFLKCLSCKLGKATRLPFRRRNEIKTTKPLELVHSDLSGIIRIANPDGYRYFLTFIDDFSRFRVIFLLARKYQVLDAFKQFHVYMERQTGCKLQAIRSDNGTEYTNTAFETYLAENGIQRQLTVAGSPQSNGVAERENRTLVNAARCLLIEQNISSRFWPQAIAYAAHIKNCVPSSPLHGRIPYEVMHSKQVDFSRLKLFGSPVVIVDLNANDKLSPRGLPGIFMGYPDDHSGVEVYLIDEKRLKLSRDVHFLSAQECTEFNSRYHDELPVCEEPEVFKHMSLRENENTADRFMDDELHADLTLSDDQHINAASSNDSNGNENASAPNSSIQAYDANSADPPNGRFVLNRTQQAQIKQRFPNAKFTYVGPHASATRHNKRSVWDVQHVVNSIAHTFSPEEARAYVPSTYRQAMQCDDHLLWKAALDEEHQSLIRNEVYRLVQRPNGIRVLPGMWLFKTKLDQYGRVIRRKARYVILGNKQLLITGNTYAPVINSLSLRTLLAIAVSNGLEVHHIDVKTAYLNSELREKVHVQQPPGFIKPGEELLVCELAKAIYGLRSSAKAWFEKLNVVLSECGLERMLSDECVFHNGKSGRELIIVAVYVDDLNLIGTAENVEKLKAKLKKRFDITDKGRISDCLGLEIDYDLSKGVMLISQKKYCREMLHKFGMQNCKDAATPIGSDVKLLIEVTDPVGDNEQYRSIVGSLMYLANNSRPDLAYVVSILARFANNPDKIHLTTAKRVLRHVKATIDTTLIYKSGGARNIVVMSDSDFARDEITSSSVSGVCSFVCDNLVGWSSFKQTRVAQATCEAEVLSVLEGINEIEYLRNFISELNMLDLVKEPTVLFNDNQGCLSSVENGGNFRRNKHYKIRLNRCRRAVQEKLCTVQYKQTDLMIADALTKQLSRANSDRLWSSAGLNIQ